MGIVEDAARFNQPYSLVMSGRGLYGSDTANCKVRPIK